MKGAKCELMRMRLAINTQERACADIDTQIQVTKRDAVKVAAPSGYKGKPIFRNLRTCKDTIDRATATLRSQEDAWHRQKHQEFLDRLQHASGARSCRAPPVTSYVPEPTSQYSLRLGRDAKHDPAWEAVERMRRQIADERARAEGKQNATDLASQQKEIMEERRRRKAGSTSIPTPGARPQPTSFTIPAWMRCGCMS